MVDINNIKNIAVIGGGIMGSGISQVALLSGYEKVTVIDLNSEILRKSKDLIQERITALESEDNFKRFLSANNITEGPMIGLNINRKKDEFESVGILAHNVNTETIMERLKTETDISKGVEDADFVIEAVTEKLKLKQNIFKNLGEFSPPTTILASNTSSMSITKIAQFSSRPEKIIGMHFHTFFPLLGMLIEITPGEKSSNEALEVGGSVAQNFPCLTGERFTVQLEKETAGLIANRISLIPSGTYFDWVLDNAIDNGFTFKQLGALNYLYGIMDSVGLDTAYNILKYFAEYVSPDFTPGKYLTKMVNAGRLGKKVGKGYLDWNENGSMENPPLLDAKATEFLMHHLDADIFSALTLNEACRLLEEGVVKSFRLIDKVIFKGNSTPGPFTVGKDKYKEYAKKLYDIAEKTGKSYFKPCKMMESGKFLSYK